MFRSDVCDLADCSEFRQTLQGRPPVLVHAAAGLISLLVAAAVVWAAIVEANLVVQASGRVRPIDEPAQVFTTAASYLEGRVAEVCFLEGGQVTRGQVLLRLETQQLENEIARLKQRIAADEVQSAELDRLESLLKGQFTSAKTKALAELAQAQQELSVAGKHQASQILQCRAELDAAADRLERYRKVFRQGVVTEESIVAARTQMRQAEEKLKQAQLLVDTGKVDVLRAALDGVHDDFDVRLAELAVRKVVKRGDIDVASKELANLLLARERAVLCAPVDGIVVSEQINVGDVLQAGKPVVEIAEQDGFRFEADVPGSDVGDLEVGMPVKIKFDAYDYQKYGTLDGTVCFISPDSRIAQSETTIAASTAGPLSFTVRIDLHGREFGRGPLRGVVKLGLGGTAEVVTDRESILAIFLKKIRRTISFA